MVAQLSKEAIVALALQFSTRIDEIVDITSKLVDLFKEEFVPLDAILAVMGEINKELIVKLMEEWDENGTLAYDTQNEVARKTKLLGLGEKAKAHISSTTSPS